MVIVRFRSPRTAVMRQGFDAVYLERLRRGDPATQDHFSAYFGELILIKARARHLCPTEADDVRQKTFERVFQRLGSPDGLRSAEALGAFVNGVCNNVLHEHYREQKRHQPPAEEPDPGPDTRTPSPEAQLITKERQQAVREVMEAMSPDNGRLLREVLLDERDRSEVCRELNVSPDYLRVLIHRAKKEFRALYVDRERASARVDDGSKSSEGGRPALRRAAGDRRPTRRTLGL
jgi:RNA polymerase sigma-70 factor (ECF subfamily)